MTRLPIARVSTLVALLAAALAPGGSRLAAQEPRPPEAPQPYVELYPSLGLSVHQTPLTTTFAEVLPASLRLGVPIGHRGIEPWIGGAVAHLKLTCPADQPACSKQEERALVGLAYRPPGLGGVYAAAGGGVRIFRGTEGFAHTLLIGLAFPATRYVAPGFELRSEAYPGGLRELLIMAAVLRVSLPR
jgi:hypothetical protein